MVLLVNLGDLSRSLVAELGDLQNEHLEVFDAVLRLSLADMVRRNNYCLVDTLTGCGARCIRENVAPGLGFGLAIVYCQFHHSLPSGLAGLASASCSGYLLNGPSTQTKMANLCRYVIRYIRWIRSVRGLGD